VSDFQPPRTPRVDGIAAEWIPDVHIQDVIRLDRLGYSAKMIAAALKVDVLTIEHALKTVATLKMLEGWNVR
jgi:hypothetical protein